MKNTAEITSDGTSVYLNSAIIPDRIVKITLLLANLFTFTIYGAIIYATWGTGLPRFSLFAIYAVLPVLYAISLGKLSLWNLFGREHIVISTKNIAYSRDYGLFSTGLKILPFKKLQYSITETRNASGDILGTIQFARHNDAGIRVNFFSSGIKIPIKQLRNLAGHIKRLFSLEQLTDPEYEIIHLN
jgi:hypothetical protein